MTVPKRRTLHEDQAVRDAALALVKADYANLRGDLAKRGLGARAMDRLGEGAMEVFEEASELAEDHRGIFYTLLAAIGIWLARYPIGALFGDDDEEGEPEEADGYDDEAAVHPAHPYRPYYDPEIAAAEDVRPPRRFGRR